MPPREAPLWRADSSGGRTDRRTNGPKDGQTEPGSRRVHPRAGASRRQELAGFLLISMRPLEPHRQMNGSRLARRSRARGLISGRDLLLAQCQLAFLLRSRRRLCAGRNEPRWGLIFANSRCGRRARARPPGGRGLNLAEPSILAHDKHKLSGAAVRSLARSFARAPIPILPLSLGGGAP